jgi:hypothetical protein
MPVVRLADDYMEVYMCSGQLVVYVHWMFMMILDSP